MNRFSILGLDHCAPAKAGTVWILALLMAVGVQRLPGLAGAVDLAVKR